MPEPSLLPSLVKPTTANPILSQPSRPANKSVFISLANLIKITLQGEGGGVNPYISGYLCIIIWLCILCIHK